MGHQRLIKREDWAKQKEPGNLDFPHEFLLFNAEQIRAHLAELPVTARLFESTLAGYIKLVCEYCGQNKSVLPDKQDFFVATSDFNDELRALEAEGYVGKLDQNWLWTDKIAPMTTGKIKWSET